MKRSIAFLIFAALLTGCADSATLSAEQTSASITAATVTAEQTITETVAAISSEAISITTTTVDEITSEVIEESEEVTFASYLSAYTERNEFPPYGILIEDINGDGQDEMVMHINPFGNLDILYMKDGVVKVVNCEVMSQWGHTWYDSDKNRIINEYFHGHTEGTAGAYEYYVYDWDGEDYVLTMHLERESGYFEREADGVTKTDNFIYGQSYLNGVEISNERFEELHAELATPMTSVNHLDMIPSGAFETDEALKAEQEEVYNAYIREKLFL